MLLWLLLACNQIIEIEIIERSNFWKQYFPPPSSINHHHSSRSTPKIKVKKIVKISSLNRQVTLEDKCEMITKYFLLGFEMTQPHSRKGYGTQSHDQKYVMQYVIRIFCAKCFLPRFYKIMQMSTEFFTRSLTYKENSPPSVDLDLRVILFRIPVIIFTSVSH